MASKIGHCPPSVLTHISDLEPSIKSSFPICDVCHLAKQSRLPFPSSNSRADKILEFLHLDLWGPYHTPTLTNAHYFLTIVDDYSRVTRTFLLKYKTQVCNTLTNFILQIQKQYDASVKQIRTDNGTELINHN